MEESTNTETLGFSRFARNDSRELRRSHQRGTFARRSSNQFSTTAILGRGRLAGSLVMRNRSPSRETS